MQRIASFVFIFATIVPIIGCQSTSQNTLEKKVEVKLEAKNNSNASGLVMISEYANGEIQITGKISGLSSNSLHGFHFHENGDCSDNEALKAGAHFNPDKNHIHGKSIANTEYGKQHAGDLGNILADKNGEAKIDILIKAPALTLNDENKYSLLNRSLVVHENKDDEKSAPAGNAGKRILCGVIKS
ncbi:superoxide dismutase family protein [Fluviispira vulneris]|uniref:superoxide dismutase family protein n=1 Tax=Fluviispira vulneris TaxID=2763012 RepID=UPI001644F88B|nr:superoxide dismutase family protein [Fluviispira vulneris]